MQPGYWCSVSGQFTKKNIVNMEDIFIVSDTSEYLHLIAEEKCHEFVLSTETVHGNKIEEFNHLNL